MPPSSSSSQRTRPRSLPRFAADTPPEAVLAWATDAFPDVVLASALGPQTVAILELLHQAGRPLSVFFLDTGLHFPETYALRLRLQRRYRATIQAVRPALSVEAQAERHGERLWARAPERCCQIRKVEPLAAVLAGRGAWITGLRRDGRGREDVQAVEWDAAHSMVKVNPLFAWTRAQVLDFLRAHDVPHSPLLSQGYQSVGCAPCTHPTPSGGHERDGRWAGQEKTECGIHHLFATGAEQ